MGIGQTAGGPLRRLALLAPRGEAFGDGPNDFQVNKTFALGGHRPRRRVGADWRLRCRWPASERTALTRAPSCWACAQTTASLPIACVEGWSTTQRWTGVPIAGAGADGRRRQAGELEVRSLQQSGTFRRATLSPGAGAPTGGRCWR